MYYVIAYDIPEDRVRTRIATVLEGYGWRVQKSVFECNLESDRAERLTAELQEELEGTEEGSVRFYRLCADCFEKAYGLGALTDGPGSKRWLVL